MTVSDLTYKGQTDKQMAQITLGTVTLTHPSFDPTQWQTTLLAMAIVIAVSAFNVYLSRHLPISEGIFVVCHVFLFFPLVITL